jgi:hypothetical protein
MFGDCLPSPLIHARGILLNVRGTHHVVGYFDTHFGVDMLPEFYRRGWTQRPRIHNIYGGYDLHQFLPTWGG